MHVRGLRGLFSGIGLSLFAGICYGLTFVPVIYIQDNPEKFNNPPKAAIDYAFSHYAGVYLTSTTVLVIYLAFTQNRPFVNPKIIAPSLFAGLLWSIAQLSWCGQVSYLIFTHFFRFVANDALSQAITFPINA